MTKAKIPKLRKELPYVYSLTYKTQYEMCMSLVRIEEFYECPNAKFRGHYFNLEDYMDYWSKKFGEGSFDYPSQWHGFNVSGKTIMKWFKKFDHELRPREEVLLFDVILNRLSLDDLAKSYIVALNREDDELVGTRKHELSHAMYCTYPPYRKASQNLLRAKYKDPSYQKAKKELKKMGYNDAQLSDELIAYWATGEEDPDEHLGGDPVFMANFKKYYAMRKNCSG